MAFRSRAVTCVRTELSPFVCNESSSEGRRANRRSGPRLQKDEPVSRSKAFAFEIGRVGRSCLLKEDPIKLGMHPGKTVPATNFTGFAHPSLAILKTSFDRHTCPRRQFGYAQSRALPENLISRVISPSLSSTVSRLFVHKDPCRRSTQARSCAR
jgi:hypothetical protein